MISATEETGQDRKGWEYELGPHWNQSTVGLSLRRCHLLKSEEKEGRGWGQGSGIPAYKMCKMQEEFNLFDTKQPHIGRLKGQRPKKIVKN